MNALEKIIRDIIAAQGALSMAAYMELALQHPSYGYYCVREPVGRDGDFITAPEVSQLFGEMIGVWCAETWRDMGGIDPFALVELGPGKGTMMADIMRATAKAGTFHHAKKLFLIDSDRALRDRQMQCLADYAPTHLERVAQLPNMTSIIVANEFFDAMPVRQFEMTFNGWAERMVGLDEGGALATSLRLLTAPEINLIPADLRAAAPGSVFEFSPRAQTLMRELATQLVARKGAMLLIDYGYAVPSLRPTVQAVSHHAYADIFKDPGEVDLTAHVDFVALADVAQAAGAEASPVIGQGEFLRNLGIEIRAEALKKRATPAQAADIDEALLRLIGDSQMGNLFKVMEIHG